MSVAKINSVLKSNSNLSFKRENSVTNELPQNKYQSPEDIKSNNNSSSSRSAIISTIIALGAAGITTFAILKTKKKNAECQKALEELNNAKKKLQELEKKSKDAVTETTENTQIKTDAVKDKKIKRTKKKHKQDFKKTSTQNETIKRTIDIDDLKKQQLLYEDYLAYRFKLLDQKWRKIRKGKKAPNIPLFEAIRKRSDLLARINYYENIIAKLEANKTAEELLNDKAYNTAIERLEKCRENYKQLGTRTVKFFESIGSHINIGKKSSANKKKKTQTNNNPPAQTQKTPFKQRISAWWDKHFPKKEKPVDTNTPSVENDAEPKVPLKQRISAWWDKHFPKKEKPVGTNTPSAENPADSQILDDKKTTSAWDNWWNKHFPSTKKPIDEQKYDNWWDEFWGNWMDKHFPAKDNKDAKDMPLIIPNSVSNWFKSIFKKSKSIDGNPTEKTGFIDSLKKRWTEAQNARRVAKKEKYDAIKNAKEEMDEALQNLEYAKKGLNPKQLENSLIYQNAKERYLKCKEKYEALTGQKFLSSISKKFENWTKNFQNWINKLGEKSKKSNKPNTETETIIIPDENPNSVNLHSDDLPKFDLPQIDEPIIPNTSEKGASGFYGLD